MGECIPVIEALSLELSNLQTRFPLDLTFNDLPNDLPTLLNTSLPLSSNNPASGFITECTNQAHIKLAAYYGLIDNLS
jgi:hypothetical protein